MKRSIVLRSPTVRDFAVAAVSNLPTDPDSPLEVLIRPYKAQRKPEQLGLYWVRLKEISEQAYIQGNRYSDEVLHEYAKREFLPDETAKGVQKWTCLPSGERVLKMGTGDLNVSEFALYLQQVEAWGAGLGVMFGEREAA